MNTQRKFIVGMITALFAVPLFFGCSGKKESQKTPLYLAVDTIIVNDMMQSYLNKLMVKDYDEAFKMLWIVRRDTVMPINDSLKNQLLTQFETMPVLDYTKRSEDWTDIDPILFTYSIKFADFADKAIPCTYNLTLQPIRKNGLWYLTFPGKMVNK